MSTRRGFYGLTSMLTRKMGPIMRQGKKHPADPLDYFFTKFKSGLGGKVDKEKGKGLSTNDYSAEDKAKVDGIIYATAEDIDKLF